MRRFFFLFFTFLGHLLFAENTLSERLLECSFRQDQEGLNRLFQEVCLEKSHEYKDFKQELERSLWVRTKIAVDPVRHKKVLSQLSLMLKPTRQQEGDRIFYSYPHSTHAFYTILLEWLVTLMKPLFPAFSDWMQTSFLENTFLDVEMGWIRNFIVEGDALQPYMSNFETIAWGYSNEWVIDAYITNPLLIAAMQVAGGTILLMSPYPELQTMGYFLIREGMAKGIAELKHIAEELGVYRGT